MKEFIKKHLSTIIILAAFTLTMLLQLIIRNMYIALTGFIIAALGMMFGKKEDRFAFLLFLLPFSRVLKLDIRQTSLYTFLILEYMILVILDHIIEKREIPRKAIIPGILYAILGVYVLIQYVAFRDYVSINRVISVSMYTAIPLFYFVDCHRADDENKTDLVKFLLWGFIATALLSLLSYVVPRIEANLYYLIDDEIGHIGGVRRFSGLFGDSNYYAFYSLGVASLGALNIKKLHPKNLYIGVIGFIFLLGFLTLSMMYIIVAISLLLYLFILLFKSKPKVGLISTLAFSVILIILMLIIGDKIMGIIMAKIGDFSLSDITTGRTDIWYDHIVYLFNNPSLVLSGHGISADTTDHFVSIWGNVNTAAHNSLLELVYDYGLIGGTLLVTYVLTCLSCFGAGFKKIFKNKMAWFMILTFFVCGSAIELVENEYAPYFLLILCFSLGTLDKKEQVGLTRLNEDGTIKAKEKTSNNKNALIPIILSGVSAILSFAFTFLAAKELGTELYGKIEYYIGIITFTALLLGFGLPSFLNKETQFADDKKKFFTNVIVLFSIICAIGVPIFLLIGYFLLGGLAKNISLISLIYVASIFSSLGTLIASYYIGRKENGKSIILTSIIPHAIVLVISIVFLLTRKEELPDYYIYISIFAYVIAAIPCLVTNIKKCKFSMSKKQFALIMSFYAVTLTSSLFTQLSKILQAEINQSFSTVGILSVSIKVISIITIFLTVISNIAMPEFARLSKEKDYDNLIKYYRKITRVNSYIVIPFLIAIAIQGETVLGLFGTDYTEHMWIFWFLVADAFFGRIVGPTGLMLLMIGHEKYEIFNGLIKMVIFLAIGIPLGLHYVWGLPLAIFASNAVINVIKFIEVKKVTKRNPYSLKMIIQILVLSVISVGVFLLTNMIVDIYMWFIANALLGVGLILAFFMLSPYKEDKYFLFRGNTSENKQ